MQAKSELGFTYGRICGLFDSGMQLRLEHDDHITNFNYMDMILDFCVEQHIKPLICLGNLPETIFKDANTFVYRRPSEMIFENVAECRSVLNDFMTHIVGRYGREAVSAWKFECWYDEFYENTMGISGPFPPVFTVICQEIKRHVPGAAVGGCGLSVAISEEKFKNLLAAWTLEACRPDFISINLYPYARMDLPGELRAKRRFNTDSHYKEEVLKSRDLINACGWPDLPLYVVEWNISMSQRNPFNDSCGKAATDGPEDGGFIGCGGFCRLRRAQRLQWTLL